MTIAGMVGERMASATGQNDSGHLDTHTILEYSGLPVDEMAWANEWQFLVHI